MNKRFSSLIPIVILLVANTLCAQIEAKFNLASAAFLVPNVGIELQLSEHTSAQLDILGSFHDDFGGSPLHVNQTFLEYRYYPKQNIKGLFIGAHVGYGMFTLKKPNWAMIYDRWGSGKKRNNNNLKYESGRVAFYGLTTGYKKRISDKFALEVFLGAGLSQSKYRGYEGLNRVDYPFNPTDPDYEQNLRSFNGSGEVLFYRGGIMLSYQFKPYKRSGN